MVKHDPEPRSFASSTLRLAMVLVEMNSLSDEWDGLWSTDEDNYTIDQVFVNLGGHTCECGY